MKHELMKITEGTFFILILHLQFVRKIFVRAKKQLCATSLHRPLVPHTYGDL